MSSHTRGFPTLEGCSQLVPVTLFAPEESRTAADSRGERGQWCCEQLERGNILFFPLTPFPFPEEERAFLLAQRQSGAAYHKNIAYRPEEDRLTGVATRESGNEEKLRSALRAYSERVTGFLTELLAPYAGKLRRDFASFRPLEERGRQLRLRARNDLLHTDAFPTRPTNGDRILRFFTNLNPTEPRVWVTSETFERLAQRYAQAGGLDLRRIAAKRGRAGWLSRLGRALGLVAERSAYDDFMLRFHNFLKENQQFQQSCPKNRWEFPPGSSWMVYTDMVSHAVLAGRFALEQTFIVPRDAMVLPGMAPATILERICGQPLTKLV